MAETATIHHQDVGTIIVLTVTDETGAVVDLSTASTKTILLCKPSGAVLAKTASFTTDGKDGKIQCTATKSGTPSVYDIDEIGTWKAQAYVVLVAGEWYSTTATFTVSANVYQTRPTNSL